MKMNQTMIGIRSSTPKGGTIAYESRGNISTSASRTVSNKERSNSRCYNCKGTEHNTAECRSSKPPSNDGSSKLSRFCDTDNRHSYGTNTPGGGKISTRKKRTSDTLLVTITVDNGVSKHSINDQSLF